MLDELPLRKRMQFYDDETAGQWLRAYARPACAPAGAYGVLCPGVDTIKARESTHNKTGYTGFTVEALYDDFMSSTPCIGLWIDNSALTPKETVDMILKEAGL